MKKIWSILLVIVLLIGMLPVIPVYAEGDYPPIVIDQQMFENPHNFVAKTQIFKLTARMLRHQRGKHRARLYEVELTGQENVQELSQLGIKLWKEGADYLEERYSETSDTSSTEYRFSEEVICRFYKPGSYLLVVCCEVDGQPLPDTAYATAVHIVEEEIPLEKFNFYLCDENWEKRQLLNPDDILVLSEEEETYLYIEKVPYNATCRLGYIEAEWDTTAWYSYPVFSARSEGQGRFALGGDFCGENPMQIYVGDYINEFPETVIYGPTCAVRTHKTEQTEEIIMQPTATKPGVETAVCQRCKKEVEIQIPAVFSDTKADSFYSDAVDYCYDNGIVNGLSATSFGPSNPCKRSEVVTFLHRAEGKPAASADTGFTDVQVGKFYTDAVAWAVENNITNGMGDGTFGVSKECTRAQVVTFLWRAAGCPEPTSTEHPFTDLNPEGFYYDAVLWAVENGITSGMSATTFVPGGTCTRAQIVTFLYRFAG